MTATAADLGISRKDIHEARIIRDAEAADPGIIRRTLEKRLAEGAEPSKAALREAVASVARPDVKPASRKEATGRRVLRQTDRDWQRPTWRRILHPLSVLLSQLGRVHFQPSTARSVSDPVAFGHNETAVRLGILAHDAQLALGRVAQGEGDAIEGWIAYGAALNEGRALFPGKENDRAFGEWCAGIMSDKLSDIPNDHERAAAMWAAAYPEQFEQARAAGNARTVRHAGRIRTRVTHAPLFPRRARGAWLYEAWTRYLPPPPQNLETRETRETGCGDVSDVSDVSDPQRGRETRYSGLGRPMPSAVASGYSST